MINYLIESTLIWLALYAYYHFFLRKETYFQINRAYLLIALMAGLLLPLLNIRLSFGANSELLSYVMDPIRVSGVQGMTDDSTAIVEPGTSSGSGYIKITILSIYILGSSIVLSRLASGLFKLWNIYKKGSKKRNSIYTEVIIDQKIIPFSFLHFLFIPSTAIISGDYEVIKTHELRHIKDRHSVDILLLELLRIFFWFNPIIYIFKKAMVENHEFIADTACLQETEKYAYGKLLLKIKESSSLPVLTNNLNNSIIKKRLDMMYKSKSNKSVSMKYLLALPLIFSLLFLFSCKQESENNSEESNQETSEEVQKTIPDDETVDQVFEVVEKMPRFPGCNDENMSREELEKCSNKKLNEYLFNNLKYPEAARKKGVEGTVIASFVVTESGNIQDIKLLKDIGDGCGEEVIRIVESMNKMETLWTPGSQTGKKVKVKYTLPVKFKLS